MTWQHRKTPSDILYDALWDYWLNDTREAKRKLYRVASIVAHQHKEEADDGKTE